MKDYDADSIFADLLDRYHVVREPNGMTRTEYANKYNVSYDAAKKILEKATSVGALRRVDGVGSAGVIVYYPLIKS